MANNEGKVCDAVVRTLEELTGETRAKIRYPEIDRAGPLVDLRFQLGALGYAVEHTQIEAFAQQIRMGEEFQRFITPVTDELSERLPGPAVYHLYFPIDAGLGVKANELDVLRKGFIEWVRETAQHLHEMHPERPTREENPRGFSDRISERPPDFPYEVTLQREAHWSLSPRHDGVLLPARIAPDEVENLRALRLRQALERKCPKLRHCKEEGSRTILVLEDRDMALTNHALVGAQLADLLAERADIPDEIYLVETALDRWTVWPMKRDDRIWPIEGWVEFHVDELSDLTAAAKAGKPARALHARRTRRARGS